MAAMTLDIGDAGAIEDFARRAIAEHPDLNVLINNAGIMRFESLDRRSDLTDAEATITTNLLGPIRLTNALIDHLSARPDAATVNVISGIAFVPLLTTTRTDTRWGGQRCGRYVRSLEETTTRKK